MTLADLQLGGSLVVMLDWENFPGIRPSDEALPLADILAFLRRHFDVRDMLAYAHRSTLSAPWEQRLVEAGFEIRLLDGLIDANDKKNSLDLCLAMEAVRLSYTQGPTAYAMLVAGDKDFAVVSAFIRRRLSRHVIAFGSLYCPNPTLAGQVDRYFILEQLSDWDRQLHEGTGRFIPRLLGPAVQRRAESQRAFVVAGLSELGPDVPRALGALLPAIRRRHPEFRARGDLRLSTIAEALGCQLSPDRQFILAWADDLLRAAERHAGDDWSVPLDVPGARHVSDRTRLSKLASGLDHTFRAFDQVCFPMPLSVLQAAMHQASPSTRQLLSKRLRLWHVLADLGFSLTPDHTTLLGASSATARRLVSSNQAARQLALFAEARAVAKCIPRRPRAQRPELDEREQTLTERVSNTDTLGPLFARLIGRSVQGSLPFAHA